jgi:FtsH-binding integral membrane protein
MPVGPVTVPAAFILAFVAGVAAFWLSLGFIMGALLRGPDTALPYIVLALPLFGIAVFQLIFSRITGLWRGAHFWLWAVTATYALGAIAMMAATSGLIPWLMAFAVFLGLLGGMGLWRAGESGRRKEGEQ